MISRGWATSGEFHVDNRVSGAGYQEEHLGFFSHGFMAAVVSVNTREQRERRSKRRPSPLALFTSPLSLTHADWRCLPVCQKSEIMACFRAGGVNQVAGIFKGRREPTAENLKHPERVLCLCSSEQEQWTGIYSVWIRVTLCHPQAAANAAKN